MCTFFAPLPKSKALKVSITFQLRMPGCQPEDLQLVLPSFRYRATDPGGIVENELCPVWLGRIAPGRLRPDPSEVMDTSWADCQGLQRLAATLPQLLSPWAVRQVPLLAAALSESEGVA